ncbi:uncharacterized protein MKK02DRAFT_28411 [Dioszegia hungarica]|uniref:TIGR02453 family protein n=1 Tax=Dioszegia hungarica TaxID=4972 RepID=A0AA38H6R7_9TREE|nr:uncharacterized protein MKK02DRAFT_28411 [Dioszegia hungarica]KAI9633604.1 hypothetical protein MKK02DRAFT_28411 [Dioszegia hungarica]
MAPSKSPRTPRASRGSAPAAGSSNRPSRKSTSAAGSPLTPVKTPDTLKGKSSPYFKGRATASPSKGRVSAKVQANGNGKAAAKRGKAKKDPADVTGLTSTEEEDSSDSDAASEDDFAPSSAGGNAGGEEDEDEDMDEDEEDEDESDVDSDDLDGGGSKSKRKRGTPKKGSATKKVKVESGKKGKVAGKTRVDGFEDDEEDDMEVELEEGQEVAGRIYPAPKTGQVPPGRISQNTLNFLKNMQIPERNDRDWFRSHEPAFRQAEKEWQAFVGLVQLKMHEADSQVPILPPKDLIHRIYRDVRFSSDKTPYKRSFSLSTSRSGRKGVFAGYHLSLCPNDKSILAAGVWCPAKTEMQTIRHHLLNTPERFRDVIGSEAFVDMFGPASPGKKGERRNVFGHEDALKVAPKGVDKGHKDIDLLKLRSVAVVKHFTDEEVLDLDFQETVKNVVNVMTPFVHLLNDFISLPP